MFPSEIAENVNKNETVQSGPKSEYLLYQPRSGALWEKHANGLRSNRWFLQIVYICTGKPEPTLNRIEEKRNLKKCDDLFRNLKNTATN